MVACSTKCSALVVVCIVSYVLVSLPLALGLLGVWEPRRQGFFCGDESISLPYARDTVSFGAMLGVSFGGVVVVAVAEGFCAKRRGLKRSAILLESLICAGMLLYIMAAAMSAVFGMKLSMGALRPHFLAVCKTIGLKRPAIFVNSIICAYVLILIITGAYSAVKAIKVTMGALRPHFLAVCKVNVSFTCTPGTYVTEDVCTGDADVIRDARSSFPSGHAGIAGCLAAYVVMYLQTRVRNKSWVVPRVVVQVGLVIGALYVMGSRVADHRHHLADVIGGAVIGAAFGVGGMSVTQELTKPTFKRVARQDTDGHFSARQEAVGELSEI
ncbi:phospholipid phosphatase 1-like isoform X1 [Branchiostoma floridae]|uniref:Phospholipid phosphatase 1-like isoform X1 n=1 Tax=Branchiostoma floridae TaxID=7739 RepID=A0A9J7HNZ7_BRAFL|nr:phospholipid phosphatase 1-like isoform X1 [Branchiostoma floridae]